MPLKLEGGDIMRACEVMKLLRISRQTLSNYTKKGLIRTTTLVNGRYDYTIVKQGFYYLRRKVTLIFRKINISCT